MSNFAPLHYRKLRIAEHGSVRTASVPRARYCRRMILKFCDDRGVFALRGKAPVDAVTRASAEPSERKAIARHIEELIDVGYLRYGNDS